MRKVDGEPPAEDETDEEPLRVVPVMSGTDVPSPVGVALNDAQPGEEVRIAASLSAGWFL